MGLPLQEFYLPVTYVLAISIAIDFIIYPPSPFNKYLENRRISRAIRQGGYQTRFDFDDDGNIIYGFPLDNRASRARIK